eukprot:2763394-Prorocentrum_lima.AAC.1
MKEEGHLYEQRASQVQDQAAGNRVLRESAAEVGHLPWQEILTLEMHSCLAQSTVLDASP